MPRLRFLAYNGQGTAGPWVILNPSIAVTGVFIEKMIIDGTFGDEVFIVLFRAPIRSIFRQRLALAKHLFYDRADGRLVWAREHQLRSGFDEILVDVEVSVAEGQDQALFCAVVGAVEPFELEVFGQYFK